MKTPKSLSNTKVYPMMFASIDTKVFQIFPKMCSMSVIPTLYPMLQLSK